MRNKFTHPTIGHVMMFVGITVGWLLLLLITLNGPPGPTFWIKVVFSGLFLAGSAVATVLLYRGSRRKDTPGRG